MDEYILHLETSSTICSVAISKGPSIVSLKELNEGYTHAENLHEFVDACIQSGGISMNQLNAISVSKGPGSYTGLRIGVSAAKGYAVALNIPLLAVNTLLILANHAKSKSSKNGSCFVPMIDARREEVFCAIFDSSMNVKKETCALILSEENTNFFPTDQHFYFFGSGAEKARKYLEKYNAEFLEGIEPSAKLMVEPALNKFRDSDFEDTAYFEPFYLKEFFSTAKLVKLPDQKE